MFMHSFIYPCLCKVTVILLKRFVLFIVLSSAADFSGILWFWDFTAAHKCLSPLNLSSSAQIAFIWCDQLNHHHYVVVSYWRKERGRASKPNPQNQWRTNNETERKTWMKPMRGSVSMRGRECEQCAVVLTTSSDTVAHACFSDRKQWRFDGKWAANNKLTKVPASHSEKKEGWGMLSQSAGCYSYSWRAIFNVVYSIPVKATWSP